MFFLFILKKQGEKGGERREEKRREEKRREEKEILLIKSFDIPFRKNT
jgi:hypothetical protein